jgi:hypothetical protein
VRGFGTLPKSQPAPPTAASITPEPLAEASDPAVPVATASDGPPPGTPKEFLGLPKVPPARPRGAKSAIDAEKIAKLKQKMREQGMLPPDEQ